MAWEREKLPLSTDHMTGYREDPKQSTYKLPKLIGEFGKIANIKGNIQKPTVQTSIHYCIITFLRYH